MIRFNLIGSWSRQRNEPNERHDAWRKVAMASRRLSRRDVLKTTAATALTAGVFAAPARAAAPPPTAITPDLIAAAIKEGKVVWYTSVDLPLAEKVARAFE